MDWTRLFLTVIELWALQSFATLSFIVPPPSLFWVWHTPSLIQAHRNLNQTTLRWTSPVASRTSETLHLSHHRVYRLHPMIEGPGLCLAETVLKQNHLQGKTANLTTNACWAALKAPQSSTSWVTALRTHRCLGLKPGSCFWIRGE